MGFSWIPHPDADAAYRVGVFPLGPISHPAYPAWVRILYLTDRLSLRGGAPHHLLDVITSMAAEHDITVAAASIDQDVTLPEGVSFERINGLRSSSAREGGLSQLDSLLAWADLTHVQNVMNPVALSRATQQNTVVTVQDHRVFCPGPGKTLPSGTPCTQPMCDEVCSSCLPDEAYRSRMLELTHARLDAIKNAQRVIVLSRYMAQALQQVGVENVAVVPPPVVQGPPKLNAGHGFLLAGRLVRHKAPDSAHAAWLRSGTQQPLRLAGLGSEKEAMTDAVDLGWLSREALRTAMAEARALLFPARWQEPFGIVGAEALSMGTPVIAIATGGMSDWCQAGCIVVHDVEEMASAIQYLDENPHAAMTLGQAGAQAIQADFSPPTVAKRLCSIYAEVFAE